MVNFEESKLVDKGVIPPDDFHKRIERIREVAEYQLEVPGDLITRIEREAEGILVDRTVLLEAASALLVGHLVLQGPPGTGKSTLARALCRAFNCNVLPVTAHEDWSTFEVIGRQSLQVDDAGEHVVPVNGFFTDAVIDSAGAIVRHFDDPMQPQATWLLIDELNRAHLDRAFGELFTVLGTDEPVPITLPHQPRGNREMVMPRRFRIIATLNSIDRQFVNGLSQGLRRRFTFITLDVPPPLGPGENWRNAEANSSLANREFIVVVNRAVERIAKAYLDQDNTDVEAWRNQWVRLLSSTARRPIAELFTLAGHIRYATKGSGIPYLPIGTAQLIDTVELFLSRARVLELTAEADLLSCMDWAASVKLAPLFDSDTISPRDLEQFAETLTSPFDARMRHELLEIVAAGGYYVS